MPQSPIRALRPNEAHLLLPGAREFFAAGNLMGKLNEASFVHGVRNLVTAGTGLVYAAGAEVVEGAIGVAIYPDFSTGDIVASELFWYVLNGNRGTLGVRLLKLMEGQLRLRGVSRLMMMHLETGQSAAFGNLYGRLGYCQKEHIYAKVL